MNHAPKYIVLILVILSSCNKNDNEKLLRKIIQEPTIQECQDYILEYPQSKHIKEISDTLRVLWKNELEEVWHWHCHSCIEIYIDSANRIMLGYEELSIKQLSDTIPKLIFNPHYIPHLPQKRNIELNDTLNASVPVYYLDILSSPYATNKYYSSVITSILAAFEDIKNETSNFLYNKEYSNISESEKYIIDKLVPINIRFERATDEEIKKELYEMDKRLFGGYS